VIRPMAADLTSSLSSALKSGGKILSPWWIADHVLDALHRRLPRRCCSRSTSLISMVSTTGRCPWASARRSGRLVDRRLAGIAIINHTDAPRRLVFEQACRMARGHYSGRTGHWLKIKISMVQP
jgi:hypothetical protein